MTETNYPTTKRTFKHLIDIQRGRLEEMACTGNFTQTEMANELGVSQSTISRELKRGRTCQMSTNRTYYNRYLADASSPVYRENRQSSRARDFHKYSENFFKELFKAILSTKQKHGNIVFILLFTFIGKNIQKNAFLVLKLSIH